MSKIIDTIQKKAIIATERNKKLFLPGYKLLSLYPFKGTKTMNTTLYKIISASGYILTLDYKALNALLLENHISNIADLSKIGYKLGV